MSRRRLLLVSGGSKPIDDSFTESLKLILRKLHQLSFHRINLLVQLINLVHYIVVIKLRAPDNLGDKEKFFGIRHLREEAVPGVLHDNHLFSLFLVTGLRGSTKEVGECFRNDGNQEIEKQDNVDNDAKEENEPVTLSVEFKSWVELAKSGQEWLLPSDDIGAPVLVVIFLETGHLVTAINQKTVVNDDRSWDIGFGYITILLSLHDSNHLLDRKEAISKCKDTNDKHNEEDFHIIKAGLEHSNEPAEAWNSSQVKQKSAPHEERSPSLNCPECDA